MAGAAAQPITMLSTLIRDPFVRAAFEAAERDGFEPAVVVVVSPPSLDGGAIVMPERKQSWFDHQHRSGAPRLIS